MNLGGKGVAALDHAEEVFLVLLEIAHLSGEMLEDLVGATDSDERCDIVEGRVAG